MELKKDDIVCLTFKVKGFEHDDVDGDFCKLEFPRDEYDKVGLMSPVVSFPKNWLERNAITEFPTHELVVVETNLEHYGSDILDEWCESYQCEDWGKALDEFGERYDIPKSFMSYSKDFYNWLLQPYQQPKYKLTKVEKDILELGGANDRTALEQWFFTNGLIEKGYFKGIPTDIPIKDILDNCEVVE